MKFKVDHVAHVARSLGVEVDASRFVRHWAAKKWTSNGGELMTEETLPAALMVWASRFPGSSMVNDNPMPRQEAKQEPRQVREQPTFIGDELPKVLEKYNISPIPTQYAGILFRSRIEARWAIFFDSVGLKWEYEKEGFFLPDGTAYLPDFWLPQLGVWVEIKGADPDEAACDKAHHLAEGTKCRVYVFFGGHTLPDGPDGPPVGYCFYQDGGADHGYLWCECKTCGAIGIEYEGRTDRLSCRKATCPKSKHGDKDRNFNTPKLKAAFQAARNERFQRR